MGEKLPLPGFPSYLKKFFEFPKELNNESNFSVNCRLCLNSTSFRCSKTSSSNLKKHIERKHPSSFSKLAEYAELHKKRKNDDSSSEPEKDKCKKQLSLFDCAKAATGSNISQGTFDQLLMDTINECHLPFSFVESPAFRRFMEKVQPSKTVMCRRTVANRLKDCYSISKKNLKIELSKAAFVATTADCWSSMRRSYLGVTVHWVDEETLQRRNAMLAVRRILGRHTYDVLAGALDEIFREFEINDKIIVCVTDNGSNFVKAFSAFGESNRIVIDQEQSEDELNDDEDDFTLIPMDDILSNPNACDEECNIVLPRHHRCVAHSLNLIAKKCDGNATFDSRYKKLYQSTFTKCHELWNKQQRSTVAADAIFKVYGRYFVRPSPTRWNSLYDSVSCLVQSFQKKGLDTLNSLCGNIEVQRFLHTEMAFLEEYVSVMKPFTISLDLLQGEKEKCMGYLLPTLRALCKELSEKKDDPRILVCRPLAKALLDGILERFSNILDCRDMLLAAGLVPCIKFNWLTGEEKERAVKELQILVKNRFPHISSPEQETEEDGSSIGLHFLKLKSSDDQGTPAEQELHSYLSTPVKTESLECLKSLKFIKQLYIEFNTAVPSSAPVERLFSLSKHVLSYKRGKLGDSNFEMQLFCKINKVRILLSGCLGQLTSSEHALLEALKEKFFSIVLVFYVCWLPNVVNGVILWGLWSNIPQAALICVWYIMAFLNPLQAVLNSLVYKGWGNCPTFWYSVCCRPRLAQASSFVVEESSSEYRLTSADEFSTNRIYQ